jgi:hypothetical protein
VHTSAVIFAFGGNALLGTSLYIVQRTCRARLFGGNDMGWFLFFGYQFFIITAALGYVLGVTQGKEYAEPEWYVDLWLTLVWVLYLAAFRAQPGRAGRYRPCQVVFLLGRVMAAGGVFPHRRAHSGRYRPIRRHFAVRPGLVWLHLPADGLDRSFHVGRAADRG